MKISYSWLKWYIPEAPEVNKLADVITYHLTEVESIEKIQTPSPLQGEGAGGEVDYIFDINILPNRAHDLLSHSGVGRELAGQLGIKFNDPTPMYKVPESRPTKLEVKVESQNCRRFTARIIRNIKIGPSPEWVVKHLESIGSRTINNIVDATNLVMFNCGQPTHAFDLRKFADEKIVVKNANEGEELKLVGRDGIVAKLASTDIVIANNSGETLSLAGIKGGVNSGIADDTTDILLEVANFNPTAIRKTARRIGVLSDSAKRFENDLSPELCDFAMLELTALIYEMCPEAMVEEVVGYYPNPQELKTIQFTTEFVNKKLGSNLADSDIEQIFKNYNFEYKKDSGSFVVKVPQLRLDLETPTDIAEEIGRLYGYDKLDPVLPKISFQAKVNETHQKILAVRNHLVSEGYREVMTYVFADKGEVEVLESASDKNFLRTNLGDGLKTSYELNRLNAPLLGISEVKIFEIGTVFKNSGEEIHVAYADKKGVQEFGLDEFLTKFGIDSKKSSDLLSGGVVASSIGQTIFDSIPNFVLWSPYPFITRDVSFWTTSPIDVPSLKTDLNPITPYKIDEFSKDGRTSYAYRFVFQSPEKTLTEDEISPIWQGIIDEIKRRGGEIR